MNFQMTAQWRTFRSKNCKTFYTKKYTKCLINITEWNDVLICKIKIQHFILRSTLNLNNIILYSRTLFMWTPFNLSQILIDTRLNELWLYLLISTWTFIVWSKNENFHYSRTSFVRTSFIWINFWSILD